MNIKKINDWDYDRLIEIAEEYGTPVYVTDLDRVVENYNRLNKNLDKIKVKYAAKANSEKSVLLSLKNNNKNMSLECASIEESQKCHDVGYSLDNIQVSLVNPPENSIKKAVNMSKKNSKFTVVIGAIDTIERLKNAGYSGRAFLRIKNRPRGNENIINEGAKDKFGIHADRLYQSIEKVQKSNFSFVGFHFHIGSCILTKNEISSYIDMVKRVFNIVKECPYRIEKVNLGGGLGVPYYDDKNPLGLEYFKDNLYEAIPSWFEGETIIEPGRYICADASMILSRANTIKNMNGGNKFVGIDCGLTHLIRPAMFGAQHPIENITNPDKNKKRQTLAGPTCSSADVMCYNRKITDISQGDLVAVGNSGAYGYVLTNNFHSTPKPYSIVIKGDNQGVSIEGETVEDVVEKERTPEWI